MIEFEYRSWWVSKNQIEKTLCDVIFRNLGMEYLPV